MLAAGFLGGLLSARSLAMSASLHMQAVRRGKGADSCAGVRRMPLLA
jgi:hypothetical protein